MEVLVRVRRVAGRGRADYRLAVMVDGQKVQERKLTTYGHGHWTLGVTVAKTTAKALHLVPPQGKTRVMIFLPLPEVLASKKKLESEVQAQEATLRRAGQYREDCRCSLSLSYYWLLWGAHHIRSMARDTREYARAADVLSFWTGAEMESSCYQRRRRVFRYDRV